jgi:hypothetical protein
MLGTICELSLYLYLVQNGDDEDIGVRVPEAYQNALQRASGRV